MAQRIVEIVIGRLVTDEQFRAGFLRDPRAALHAVCDRGQTLTATETMALMNTDPALWAEIADALDPRLQKAGLDGGTGV